MTSPSTTTAPGGQTRWEYRHVMATPVDKLMDELRHESENGWELVSVVLENPYYRAFLKRSASP